MQLNDRVGMVAGLRELIHLETVLYLNGFEGQALMLFVLLLLLLLVIDDNACF